jgi:hypothetical protein
VVHDADLDRAENLACSNEELFHRRLICEGSLPEMQAILAILQCKRQQGGLVRVIMRCDIRTLIWKEYIGDC